jgi:glyoxylase-like metal-dependent hydrolase (beta-lactamase superfamily II)
VKVHHLSCATLCPRGARLIDGHGGLLAPAKMVAHCLLIEAGGSLVLVDTGFGTGDVADPKRLGQPFRLALQPRPSMADTAIRQVEGLGLDPADVRHIVVTHLDLDHAGGLGDFPSAEVHVHAPELAAAKSPPLQERLRYVKAHWAHGPQWVEHEVAGETWFGFESVRIIDGIDSEIAMVPLLGHSTGHTGVAVRSGDGWLLHCGDAYFNHGEVQTPPSCPPALRVFQSIVGHDAKARRANQERLRELGRAHGDEVTLFCSHDPHELERER